MKINKKYKVVILDFEKTLVSLNINWGSLRITYADIFKKYGFQIDYQTLRPIFESTGEELKKISQSHPKDDLISQILKDLLVAQKKYEDKFIGSVTLYPDSKHFLEMLSSHNLVYLIVTNNLSSTVRKVFSKFEIPLNGFVLGRESVRYPKPDPEGILKLLEKLKIDGEDCIFIGDTDFDIEVAKKIGALVIFIKRNKDQKLFHNKPDFIITSLSEIIV